MPAGDLWTDAHAGADVGAAFTFADRDARKSDGIPRLRSDAAADAEPNEQSDGSSGLLLLHRRLRCLHGAVDGPGLLERKR